MGFIVDKVNYVRKGWRRLTGRLPQFDPEFDPYTIQRVTDKDGKATVTTYTGNFVIRVKMFDERVSRKIISANGSTSPTTYLIKEGENNFRLVVERSIFQHIVVPNGRFNVKECKKTEPEKSFVKFRIYILFPHGTYSQEFEPWYEPFFKKKPNAGTDFTIYLQPQQGVKGAEIKLAGFIPVVKDKDGKILRKQPDIDVSLPKLRVLDNRYDHRPGGRQVDRLLLKEISDPHTGFIQRLSNKILFKGKDRYSNLNQDINLLKWSDKGTAIMGAFTSEDLRDAAVGKYNIKAIFKTDKDQRYNITIGEVEFIDGDDSGSSSKDTEFPGYKSLDLEVGFE